jgi:hypothetical protein
MFQGLLFIKWGGGTIPEGPYHNFITWVFMFFCLAVGSLIDLGRYLWQIRAEIRTQGEKRSWMR